MIHPSTEILQAKLKRMQEFTKQEEAKTELKIQDLERELRDLKHIMIGVDGENGLRSKIKETEYKIKELKEELIVNQKEVRKEIRDVANFQNKLLGGLVVISTVLEFFFSHILK